MTNLGGAHPIDFELAWTPRRQIEHVEHAGTWLERCYRGENGGEDPEERKKKLVRRALYDRAIDALRMGRPAVSAWKALYERIRREREASPDARFTMEIVASERVLLHPSSNASVTDGSVLLHHTYGVPYLPGSGQKGLARAWMRLGEGIAPRKSGIPLRTDQRDSERVRALFGQLPDPERDLPGNAAVVEFMDALWVPEPPPKAPQHWSPLALDVVNPHAPKYYVGEEPVPTDHQEPVPTQRLTVAPGTRFLVELTSPIPAKESMPWLRYVAESLLRPALENMGFGAWTASGYGRFAADVGPASGRSAGAVRAAAAPVGAEWHMAMVSLDPGSGDLSARIPDDRMAKVFGAAAKALVETLPEEVRQKLKAKRKLELKIKVEPHGITWKIAGMKTE